LKRPSSTRVIERRCDDTARKRRIINSPCRSFPLFAALSFFSFPFSYLFPFASLNMTPDSQEIVIIGSGIVGLCTAYSLLSLNQSVRVKILESSTERQVAEGASQYAGGFIAGGESWHNEPSRSLARESWKCHSEMAEVLHGAENYGWRECGAIGLSVGGPVRRSAYRSLPGGKGKEAVEGEEGRLPKGEWVEGEKEELSTEGGVGQV